MTEPNPMQIVLRHQLGFDGFAIDGDDSEVPEHWTERSERRVVRRVELVR